MRGCVCVCVAMGGGGSNTTLVQSTTYNVDYVPGFT